MVPECASQYQCPKDIHNILHVKLADTISIYRLCMPVMKQGYRDMYIYLSPRKERIRSRTDSTKEVLAAKISRETEKTKGGSERRKPKIYQICYTETWLNY